MQLALLGVKVVVECMVRPLSSRDVFTRASQCVFAPQDGQEACLADFGGSGAVGALGSAQLAAKLCCAAWVLKVLQGDLVKLHVAVLFATLIAQITSLIPG